MPGAHCTATAAHTCAVASAEQRQAAGADAGGAPGAAAGDGPAAVAGRGRVCSLDTPAAAAGTPVLQPGRRVSCRAAAA